MSISVNPESQSLISGSIASAGAIVDLTSPNTATSIVQITGTWSGSLKVQGSNDSSNWNDIYVLNPNTGLYIDEISSNEAYIAPTNGFKTLRLISTTWTSGTANIKVWGSDSSSFVRSDSILRGSTDGIPIGNTEDRLKVDSQASFGTNLSYDDINASNGGIARDTLITNTWTKAYDSTLATNPGTEGLFSSVILTLEKLDEGSPDKTWKIRFVVDGFELFGSDGISSYDLTTDSIYGFDPDISKNIPEWGGLSLKNNSFRWEGPINQPIRYSQGVQIYLLKLSDDEAFRAGLVTLTKD